MNKKNLISILGIIIIILTIIIVYLAKINNTNQPKQAPIPVAQKQTVSDPRNNNTLENYTNDKIKISLDYPKEYTLKEPTLNSDVVIIKQNGKEEYLQIQTLETTPPSFDIYRPNGANFIKNISINSKTARKYFTNNPIGEGVLKNYPFTSYIIIIGDKKWIKIEYYGDDEAFENIVNSIIFDK